MAADETRLQELEDGIRRFLAWQSILADREPLDLPPHQVRQAESQLTAAESAVIARIGETYQWLLAPVQTTPQSDLEWQAIKLSGQGALADRASRKMRNDELLVTNFAGTRLRMELDRIPLWRGDHVSVRQLVEDFARYPYLPRLKDPSVLLDAIRNGLSLLTWEQDSFAYADCYDEGEERYRALRFSAQIAISDNDPGLVVRPEVARKQIDTEVLRAANAAEGKGSTYVKESEEQGKVHENSAEELTTSTPHPAARRYHGSVKLDPTRVGRDASQVADEVIAHLAGLVGSEVRLTLEIETDIPDGAPEHVKRIVIENSRNLNFDDSSFENE